MPLKRRLRKVNQVLRRAAPSYDRLWLRLRPPPPPPPAPKPKAVKPPTLPKLKPNEVHHLACETRPVVRGQVFLDSFWGRMVGCNPYAIYRQMRRDPRCDGFTYVWACNDPASIPEDMRDDPAVSFVASSSDAYQIAMATSEYLLANTNLPPHVTLRPEQVFLNPWHGTPIKHIGADADNRRVAIANTQRNYLLSAAITTYSPVATERTVDAYLAQMARPRVREIGTPRIDLTLTLTRDEIRARLGLTSDKPVLLYAPTWRGEFGRTNVGLTTQMDHIEWAAEELSDTYEVFVSAHHITAQALAKKEVSFRQVPKDMPINEMLAGVDVLVSDYSSIMVDFLVLDRPIVMFCYDFHSYLMAQGFYFDITTFPAALCQNRPDLRMALELARRPSDYPGYQAIVDDLCPQEDGGASARAVDLMFDPPAPERPSDKTSLLFYPGGMMSNGITSSIISLSHAVDYEKFDLTLVLDATATDKDPGRAPNVARLDPRCRIIYRAGAMTYLPEEAEAYRVLRETGAFGSEENQTLVHRAFARESRRILGRERFDVLVDFSGYTPFWSLILLNTPARRRLIYQHNDMHGEAFNPNQARSFPELPAVFELYKEFDGLVSVTPKIRDVNLSRLDRYYRPDTQALAARNLIDGREILRKAEVPLGLISPQAAALRDEPGLFKFCCVARLSPEKNHMLLLTAFVRVLRAAPHCVLYLIGSGKLMTELRAHAARLGIADHVVFLGQLANPYPVMKDCDCKVLASTYEGQGIVLLEAMTLGLPCIATDNPAVRDVLGDGQGTLVTQDADALARAMLSAATGRLAQGARFSWEEYERQAIAEFERCILPETATIVPLSEARDQVATTRASGAKSPRRPSAATR